MIEGVDTDRLWVCDSETFAYDNMWVFIHVASSKVDIKLDGGRWIVDVVPGTTVKVHNNNDAVQEFIDEYNPILVGFNIRDYDQHIIKANLLCFEPEHIKECNDVIIGSYNDPLAIYRHFEGEGWVELPPLVDLIPDIVGRPSLKQLEGYFGMSIEESSVPWDIDRPLTDEEILETFFYCEQDVTATLVLLYLRQEYVDSKARMCAICDVDPLKELKHPMPRVAADLLNATFQTYDNEDYVTPGIINLDNIPSPVYWFAKMLDRDAGLLTKKITKGNPRDVVFDFHGCASTVGVGGIHSVIGYLQSPRLKSGKIKGPTQAIKIPYHERSTDDRVILIQDASAYYPNTIVMHDYMSRSVPETHKDILPGFIAVKDEAKEAGNVGDEKAAKLFNNALSGTFRSPTNNLSDPMQGIALCLTCQLHVIDVIERIHQTCETVKLIQINTDGWIISIDRVELEKELGVVAAWCEETGYKVDTDMVESIWQRDVNNYIMVAEGGSIKVKGGAVGGYYGRERNWALRGFAYSNTIVDKAIVDNLVHGVDVRDTIYSETDISRFQIIAKAGSPYPKTFRDCVEVYEPIPQGSRRKHPKLLEVRRGERAQKVNRIYATKDTSCGKLMKETHAGNLQSFADTPEHAFVDNTNTEMTLDMLDREWYYKLTMKKLNDFVGLGEPMAEETAAEETKPTTTRRKPATKKPTLAFFDKYLALQLLVREALTSMEPDKYIEHISYEYIDTQVYKDVLASCCQEVGLTYSVQYDDLQFLGVLEKTRNGSNNYGVTVAGTLLIQDEPVTYYDTYYSRSDAPVLRNYVVHKAFGFGLGSGANCVSSAQTNAMRNMIVNGLLVKTAFDDDVADANKNNDEKPKVKSYVTDEQKEVAKAKVKSDNKASVTYVQGPAAKDLYERLIEALNDEEIKLGEKTEAAFEKLVGDHFGSDGTPKEKDGHLTLTKKTFTSYSNKLDELGV